MNFSKPIIYLFSLFQMLCFSACGQEKDNQVTPKGDMLIVYLSRTKNTETVAKIIQKQVGGKLVELELVNPYPENYKEIVAQVDRENDEGFLPELKTKINDLDSYGTIFLGFPTWEVNFLKFKVETKNFSLIIFQAFLE